VSLLDEIAVPTRVTPAYFNAFASRGNLAKPLENASLSLRKLCGGPFQFIRPQRFDVPRNALFQQLLAEWLDRFISVLCGQFD